MERPAKRPRIGSFPRDNVDTDDELFLDPNEVNAQRNPAVLLEQSRAVASFKLKSRWEDIIAKYEKDFSGADDIINFYTDGLPIVEVDNGHLRSLADADDAKSVAGSESADLDEEERILQGKGAGSGQLVWKGRSSLMPPRPAYGGRLSGLNSFAPEPPRLSTMFSSGLQLPSYPSFGPFTSFDTGSLWNAPELPPEAFNNHAVATTIARRRIAVKAHAAPEDDGSDDDDIIMGSTSPWMKYGAKEKDQAPAPKGATPQRSHATRTTSNTQEKVAKRAGRRKPGRPKAILQGPSLARDGETRRAHASEFPCVTEIAPGTAQKLVSGEGRRKPGRPKTRVQELSPALSAAILAEGAVTQNGKRRRGRPRKQPVVELPAQGAGSKTRSEAVVVPDSDAELLQSSSAVASDVDQLDEPSDASSSAEPSSRPANPLFRIEVQLIRRRRSDVTQAQDVSEPPLLSTVPTQAQGGKEPLSPGESVVVMETPDTETSGVPDQRYPAGVPATAVATRKEQFSRNTIDRDYDFSDKDESFVPPSRVKRSARQGQKSSSTPRRGLSKRAADSLFTGSSPSIRAAFPVVKKSIRSTGAKAQQADSSPKQPALLTLSRASAPIAQVTDEVKEPLAKTPDGPEPSSPRCDEPLPSGHLAPATDGPQTATVRATPSSNRSKEKPAPAAPALVTPFSRQSKSRQTATPSATRPSTSKRSILSLLADSDEDELSLSLDQISPLARCALKQHPALPVRSRSTVKKAPATKRMSLGSYARATPTQQKSRLSGGWKSVSATKKSRKPADMDNGDVHRTPGGTMRRCGEDGFKCERDFCFACL